MEISIHRLARLRFFPRRLWGTLPALFVGSILSFLMNLCPGIAASVLLSREVRGGTQDAILGVILYLGLLQITEGPNTTLFAIHADAPAIALILCGIIFYSKWWDSRKRFDLAASAVCFVSAIWAKQVAIPLPVIFIPLTWFLGGVRPAFVFSRWSILVSCFWLLVLTPVVTDWKTVFYNCWTIPASHPLRSEVTGGSFERLLIVLNQSELFLREYWPLYLAGFGAALSLYILANSSTPNSAAPRYSFTLIATSLIASLALLPVSLLGFSKVGGNVNQLAYSLQPLLLALSMGALALLAVARSAGARWDFVARSVVGAWLLVLIAALRPGAAILRYPLEATRAPVEIAYEESKAGNVWFPEFPLSGLLATGRMYHYSYGIFDRFLAWRPPPWQQLVRGIPQVPFTMKYLNPEGSQGSLAERMPIYLGLPSDLVSGQDGGLWRQGVVQEINMATESGRIFPGIPPASALVFPAEGFAAAGNGFCADGVWSGTRWHAGRRPANLKIWGSFCSKGDNDAGRMESQEFLAPRVLNLYLAGYPGLPGRKLTLKNVGSGNEMELRPPTPPGSTWQFSSFSLPPDWTGKRTKLIAEDSAAGVGGWFGFSEPLLNVEVEGFCPNGVFAATKYPAGVTPESLSTWGSYCESGDANTGRAASQPVIAGPHLSFYVAGYPNSTGLRLAVQNTQTGQQVPARLPEQPGLLWTRTNFPIPAEWVGQGVRIVAEDKATGVGGWMGFSEPIDPNQKPSSPSRAPLLIIPLAIVISLVLWAFRRTSGRTLPIRRRKG